MACDLSHVQKERTPFHPCLTPRGMQWFDLQVLARYQQRHLNDFKIDNIRENNKYLAKHPEIRAIVSILLRYILRRLPMTKTPAQYAANYFSRSQFVVERDIENYLAERKEPICKEGKSAMDIHVPRSEEMSFTGEETETTSQYYSYMTTLDLSSKYEIDLGGGEEYEYEEEKQDLADQDQEKTPKKRVEIFAYLSDIQMAGESPSATSDDDASCRMKSSGFVISRRNMFSDRSIRSFRSFKRYSSSYRSSSVRSSSISMVDYLLREGLGGEGSWYSYEEEVEEAVPEEGVEEEEGAGAEAEEGAGTAAGAEAEAEAEVAAT